MTGQMAFVWNNDLRKYDFGPGHALSPIRTKLAYELIRFCGLLELPNLSVLEDFEPATDKDLLRVHSKAYIAAVKKASEGTEFIDPSHGLGTEDVPVFPGMHDAAALVAGGTLAAARAVYSGSVLHGLNISGGLHHAMPEAASGFCVYNDIGVAIGWLLDQGVERIAYVDVDVHHGDGVQAIFYDNPNVMTVSLHESGKTLFPGTGLATDIGGRGARGGAVNVPLPAGTDDDEWLRAFDAVVPDVLRAFRPQILVTQQGCDTHRNDPLAHLRLSIEGQRASYLRLHALAHELTGGRWVAVGGGGYDWLDVVPRAWTHLTAIVCGAPIDPEAEVPEDYRILLDSAFGTVAPLFMGDGVSLHPQSWSDGYDPLDHVDRAIAKVRDSVYPELGLAADLYSF
ncbi:MAG: acetoin utilization protein AcuC [Actinomycetes bacterium]